MMEKDNFEEKSSSEDNDKLIRLVDYGSSSEDEDHAPLVKKRRLSDSESNTSSHADGSSNSVLEEEHWIADYDTLSDDSVGNEIQTDNDLLDFGPYSWRTGDRWNKREEYIIVVEGKREESKCLELLNEIGCEERFLDCSVEMCRAFFAQLNENKATKIKAVEGVL